MTIHGRIAVALCLSALAATLVGAPAVAAPVTRWVDDDGRAGPSSCDSRRAAKATVLDALGVARAGDTIKVCPGIYPGFLAVTRPGVSIVGVKPRKAVIRPPVVASAATPAGDPVLIMITADRVTIRGLRLDAGDTNGCWNLVGVAVDDATGVVLRGNRMEGRSDARSLTCGLSIGVFAHLLEPGRTITVTGNLIRNYSTVGIHVQGGTVRITGNTVLWAHGPQVAAVGARTPLRPGAFPAGGPSQAGIEVRGPSRATIQDNSVLKSTSAAVSPEGGIALYDSRVTVKDNRVDGPDQGLLGKGLLRGRITGNVLRNGTGNGLGLFRITPPARVAPNVVIEVDRNQVHRFGGHGMILSEAAGVVIHHHDFRNNAGSDCYDQAVPTLSHWSFGTLGRNLGNDQNQPRLCRKR